MIAPPRVAARAFVASVATVLLALVAGCGFHLQGAVALKEGTRRVYVSASDLMTPFAVELGRAVERSGGTVAPSAGEADVVLRVLHDRTGRRVLSVSARNTPQEYEVFYEVEYAIDRGGKEVVERQPLELLRTMSFEQSQLLAKDREETILSEAMARDLASLVVRRLESLPAAEAK